MFMLRPMPLSPSTLNKQRGGRDHEGGLNHANKTLLEMFWHTQF